MLFKIFCSTDEKTSEMSLFILLGAMIAVCLTTSVSIVYTISYIRRKRGVFVSKCNEIHEREDQADSDLYRILTFLVYEKVQNHRAFSTRHVDKDELVKYLDDTERDNERNVALQEIVAFYGLEPTTVLSSGKEKRRRRRRRNRKRSCDKFDRRVQILLEETKNASSPYYGFSADKIDPFRKAELNARQMENRFVSTSDNSNGSYVQFEPINKES